MVAHMPYHHLLPAIIVVSLGGLVLLAASAATDAADGDQFVYNGFTGANLTVDGSATVTPSGLVELTNGTTHEKGHAFHPSPLYLRRGTNGTTAAAAASGVRSFSVSFVFGIVSSYLDFSTHGLAFVVAPTTDLSGALTDQYLGLTNTSDDGAASNRMLAVELDTVQNVEFSDISANHVGIDVNSLTSVQSHDAGYFFSSGDGGSFFRNLSLISREAMQVWVDYDGESARIEVAMAPLGTARPATPLLSAVRDLSAVLAEPSYVGFSSATGPATSSRHYVLGWSVGTNGRPAPAIDGDKLPKLPQLPSSSSSSNRRSKVLEIVLSVASAAAVLAAGAAVIVVVRRRRRYAEVREEWETEFGPHRFAYRDLFRATRGFSDGHLLGAGGFGMVFRGVLGSGGGGGEVAVKKVAHGSQQGVKEFVAEIVSIGRIRHRNLVRLLGYCRRRRDELILVYDYMPNGSLDRYLHGGGNGDGGGTTLGWEQRFRVIRGVAAGLHYLHERWEKVVVHRDIKTSNVLLDGDMNARLGDFGLAKLYDHGDGGGQPPQQTTRVVGTTGYLAPELVRTGKASTRTDVFAFGTLVLEVTCGRRPIIAAAAAGQTTTTMLVDWVLQHWYAGTLAEAVDPRLLYDGGGGGGELSGRFSAAADEEACLALRVGLLCSHPSAEARPTMHQVLQYLDGEAPLPEMTRAELSFDMLALVQSKGMHVMSCACSTSSTMVMTSAGTISDLSGGR